MDKHRLEAFSDGVFAVAITLLVFNLVVPEPDKVGAGRLWSEIAARWPQFASYAVSFLIIGIIWVNHHAIFDRVRTITRPLLYLNLLLLLSIVALPYATNLLAAYVISSSSANAHTAAAFYSATMTIMALTFGVIWIYLASHRELLADPKDASFAWSQMRRFWSGVPIYAVTVGIAFINAVACLIVHAAIAMYYVFDRIAADEAQAVSAPLVHETGD